MVLLVYKTGAPQNGDEVVKGIVDIADGDYRFRRFRCSLCGSRPRLHPRYQHEEDGNTSASGKNTDQRADHFLPPVGKQQNFSENIERGASSFAVHLRLPALRKSTR